MKKCIEAFCTGSASAQKYLSMDQCAYCGAPCKSTCSGYCGDFPDGGIGYSCVPSEGGGGAGGSTEGGAGASGQAGAQDSGGGS